MKEFYETITPNELEKFAEKIGLGGENPVDLREIKSILDKNKAHRILEMGCGTGRLGANLITAYDYVGIDFNKIYLDYFKDKLKKEKISFLDEQLISISFFDYQGKNFDAVLFPWSVIVDFSKDEQNMVLIKAKDMLSSKGIVIIDHPQKGQVLNSAPGYNPTVFYYEDRKEDFKKLGFARAEQVLYITTTDRKQEITVLYQD